MGTCLVCKKIIESIVIGKGRPKKYCSKECRMKAGYEANNKRRRKTDKEIYKRNCGCCNAPFETEIETKKYCSPICKDRKKERKKFYKFICKHCGKDDSHYDSRYTTFCSRECSFAHAQGNKEYTPNECKICKKQLIGKGISKVYCSSCKEALNQEKQMEEQKIEKEKEKRKEEERREKLIKDRKKRELREMALNKTCQICNDPIQAISLTQKLCAKCKIVNGYIRDIARGKRSQNILPFNLERIDIDITIDKLIKKDKEICYICNKKIDKTDFSHNENRAFLAGPNYPSIDHVIPLSKGGTHTWDNVKLAHFYCNTIKSDKTIMDKNGQLQFFI